MTSARPLTLITGGCGFVGRNMCRFLLAKGHDLFVVDDLSTGLAPDQWLGKELRPSPTTRCFAAPVGLGPGIVHFVHDDLMVQLLAQLNAPSASKHRWPVFAGVFHLAGIVGGRLKIDHDPLHVGLDLAIDALMFRWLSRQAERVGRVLYASSSAAYPIAKQRSQGHAALREDDIDFDAHSVGRPDMSYGWSKLTGEYLAQLAARHYGVQIACVRPFSGYGEDQANSYPIAALAERVARGEDPIEIWGDGQQGRDFVHIDDCVQAMYLAQQRVGDGSAVNIGTGRLTSFVDVVRELLALDGRCARLALRQDRPVGVQARYADPTHMHQMLGFVPQVSLRQGLSRVLEAARRRLAMPCASRPHGQPQSSLHL